MKTTRLLYPEWQGYGEDQRVYEGAYTVLEAFSGGVPFFEVDVPADENLIVEGGILGRSAIVRSATIALDYLVPVLTDLNSHYSVAGLSVVEFASNNSSMATEILDLLEKSGITWAGT